MDFTVSVLLGTFILSIAALFVFIWSLSNGLFGDGLQAATEIFVPNELGRVEDPAATAAQIKGLQQATGTASEGDSAVSESDAKARDDADKSTSLVVGVCLTLAVVWLVSTVVGLVGPAAPRTAAGGRRMDL